MLSPALPTLGLFVPTYLTHLNESIESNPDPGELKRASSVQMFLKGYKHQDLQEVLEVTPGWIDQETKLYKLLVYLG